MKTKRDGIIGRVLGIGSALAYGISSVLVSQGVTGLAPPLVGAAVALLSGTLSLTVVNIRGLGANTGQEDRKAVWFLVIAGIFSSFGIMSHFFALSVAPVVIVSPIESTSPLFALVWSRLFLGRLEKITVRVVLGSILVVIGVVLIAFGRAA